MREILFRAKRTDNEEWVEGYYIHHVKRTICPIGDSLKTEDEQHVIYYLTREGLDWLGECLEIHIYDEED